MTQKVNGSLFMSKNSSRKSAETTFPAVGLKKHFDRTPHPPRKTGMC